MDPVYGEAVVARPMAAVDLSSWSVIQILRQVRMEKPTLVLMVVQTRDCVVVVGRHLQVTLVCECWSQIG